MKWKERCFATSRCDAWALASFSSCLHTVRISCGLSHRHLGGVFAVRNLFWGGRLDTAVSCVNEWCSSHVPDDHEFADGNARGINQLMKLRPSHSAPAGTWTRCNDWSSEPPPSLFISRTGSSGPCWVVHSFASQLLLSSGSSTREI